MHHSSDIKAYIVKLNRGMTAVQLKYHYFFFTPFSFPVFSLNTHHPVPLTPMIEN